VADKPSPTFVGHTWPKFVRSDSPPYGRLIAQTCGHDLWPQVGLTRRYCRVGRATRQYAACGRSFAAAGRLMVAPATGGRRVRPLGGGGPYPPLAAHSAAIGGKASAGWAARGCAAHVQRMLPPHYSGAICGVQHHAAGGGISSLFFYCDLKSQ